MQKPFAFLLLPLCLLVAACSLNPNLQGRGEDYIQGEWQQDSAAVPKQLLNYSLYNLKFSCDSFYVSIRTISKVNTGTDTCMNAGRWIEYVRGTYAQSNDTLHLKGMFCNANFTLKKIGGCFRSGVYEEFFKVSQKTDSLIQFSSTANVIPINAHLINKIICNPKPL